MQPEVLRPNLRPFYDMLRGIVLGTADGVALLGASVLLACGFMALAEPQVHTSAPTLTLTSREEPETPLSITANESLYSMWSLGYQTALTTPVFSYTDDASFTVHGNATFLQDVDVHGRLVVDGIDVGEELRQLRARGCR